MRWWMRRRRTASKWVLLLGGPDVILAVRQALPGHRYRIVTATTRNELHQRMQIIVPSIVLVEIRARGDIRLPALREIRRRRPPIPAFAIFDRDRCDPDSLATERRIGRALVKPLEPAQVRRMLEAEIQRDISTGLPGDARP